jgi:hypothetical protein
VSRAARFAAILGTLAAAHNVADHVIQTDAQALGKQFHWGPMAGHVASYHAAQVAALAATDRALGLGLSPRRTAVAVAFSAATHAFLDRRWPVKRALELTGSPGFAKGSYRLLAHADDPSKVINVEYVAPLNGPYLADQALHHACLWVAALIIAGGAR